MHPTQHELQRFLQQARPRQLRSMREFAEQDIVIPDGPYVGRLFRCSRQPYTRLWFDEVDSGRWSRCVATGPTQSGKTLSCFVVPLLYHLFEIGETVICGLPDMDMAADKWREDILPAIERSRYRELLPRSGGGSRGGRVETLQFRNGATLKFMSGGGSDKSRAGFTSRVVVITEVDGMDQAGGTSRESDKITQIEARTRAYGARKRIYMECTVSMETGRIWQEYSNGSQSRIMLRCPHCQQWTMPEREHLTGWQGAETQAAARLAGAFHCSLCSQPWTDEDRTRANREARLLHKGQAVDEDGEVVGESLVSDTLGFRWSAVNNLFLDAGDFAADEWRAARAADEDNAEREMRQFVWCVPVAPSKWSETALEADELAARMTDFPRGVIPGESTHLTAAIDLGKYLAHWIVVAWGNGATGHIVDYGRQEVASQDLGVEQAILVALREIKAMMEEGWPYAKVDGDLEIPHQVWIDAGYMAPVVYAFCREHGQRYLPSVGRGAGQQHRQWYNRPTSTGSLVKHVGEGFHINLLKTEGVFLVEVNADHWKTWVHQRLSTPIDQPGALSLFRTNPVEHHSLAKHLTAEAKTEEFVSGKGVVVKWERLRRQNHWFDALYNASAAGHLCGVRLTATEEPPKPARRRVSHTQSSSSRRWIDTERWQESMRRNFS